MTRSVDGTSINYKEVLNQWKQQAKTPPIPTKPIPAVPTPKSQEASPSNSPKPLLRRSRSVNHLQIEENLSSGKIEDVGSKVQEVQKTTLPASTTTPPEKRGSAPEGTKLAPGRYPRGRTSSIKQFLGIGGKKKEIQEIPISGPQDPPKKEQGPSSPVTTQEKILSFNPQEEKRKLHEITTLFEENLKAIKGQQTHLNDYSKTDPLLQHSLKIAMSHTVEILREAEKELVYRFHEALGMATSDSSYKEAFRDQRGALTEVSQKMSEFVTNMTILQKILQEENVYFVIKEKKLKEEKSIFLSTLNTFLSQLDPKLLSDLQSFERDLHSDEKAFNETCQKLEKYYNDLKEWVKKSYNNGILLETIAIHKNKQPYRSEFLMHGKKRELELSTLINGIPREISQYNIPFKSLKKSATHIYEWRKSQKFPHQIELKAIESFSQLATQLDKLQHEINHLTALPT